MGTVAEAGTEERILAAATQLFYEQGYHGTSMREVAAAVGIQPASLYNHVASKEELLLRIAAGTMEELLEGGRAAVAAARSPAERLRALVVWHVTYHAEKRFQARVADEQLHALGPASRAEVVRVRDAYTELFKGILREGRRTAGWIVPSTSVVTFGIGGMCTYVDAWYRDDGPLDPVEIAEIYAGFVLRALGGGPP